MDVQRTLYLAPNYGARTIESKLLTEGNGKVVDHIALLGMLVASGRDSGYSVVSHGANESGVLRMRR